MQILISSSVLVTLVAGDPAKGKEIGLSCFEGGADIIFAAGGATETVRSSC